MMGMGHKRDLFLRRLMLSGRRRQGLRSGSPASNLLEPPLDRRLSRLTSRLLFLNVLDVDSTLLI